MSDSSLRCLEAANPPRGAGVDRTPLARYFPASGLEYDVILAQGYAHAFGKLLGEVKM